MNEFCVFPYTENSLIDNGKRKTDERLVEMCLSDRFGVYFVMCYVVFPIGKCK